MFILETDPWDGGRAYPTRRFAGLASAVERRLDRLGAPRETAFEYYRQKMNIRLYSSFETLPSGYDALFEEAGAVSFCLTRAWFENFAADVLDASDRLCLIGVENEAPEPIPLAVLVGRHRDREFGTGWARTFSSLRELLKPGGELHIADWGKAQNRLMRLAFLGVQLLDGFDSTADNVRGRLVPLLEEAGFSAVEETHHEMTVFGTLSLYRAINP